MVRVIPSAAFAAIITAALIMLMHILIQSDMKGPGDIKVYKVPEIVMPNKEIETEFNTTKPEPPPEVQEPPPDLPELEFDAPELTQDIISINPGARDKIRINGPGLNGEGEYLPIVKVAAEYPRRATQRGKEGYCTVIYTVTTIGTTKDIQLHDCPDKTFARNSIKAASKFKYKPRVIEGEAIEVVDVKNKFIFELEDEE